MPDVLIPLALWSGSVAAQFINTFVAGATVRDAERTRELQRRQNALAHAQQVKQLREAHGLQDQLQRLLADLAAERAAATERQRQAFEERLQHLSHAFQLYHAERMKGLDASWPLKSMPMELLDDHIRQSTKPPPLLLLVAPPRYVHDGRSLGYDVRISEALRQVLHADYGPSSPRPVRLLGDIWKPDGKRREAAMRSLRTYLAGVPIIVLDSEIEANRLYFRVGYQGCGVDAPDFYVLLEHVDLDAVNPSDLTNSLLLMHQVLACVVADLHYLAISSGEIQPALVRLLPGLLRQTGVQDAEAAAAAVIRAYARFYGQHFSRLPWAPELAIEFAEQLAGDNPTVAITQVDTAIDLWLEQRGLDPAALLHDTLDVMASHLTKPADHRLYTRIRQLISQLM
jgi:hypothetical protein